MTGYYENAIAAVKTRYPSLQPEQINNSLGSVYYIFK
jgi:hypothetical protein